MKEDKVLYNRLREIRTARGITLRGLSILAHVIPSQIAMIENYNFVPTAPVRRRIAEALGVREEDIWPPELIRASLARLQYPSKRKHYREDLAAIGEDLAEKVEEDLEESDD